MRYMFIDILDRDPKYFPGKDGKYSLRRTVAVKIVFQLSPQQSNFKNFKKNNYMLIGS